ncbi:MBL fold metallo-hydrolase [Bradyrhizobium sp. Pear77]|uniref:alkyl/aryl-sulfatase n=1 Tax=Bradyrhizobium altum TaxID=1571202 RepID=UPI001E57D2D4|nr:alkyl sulfatase dimerization domain-containing protein [Bradyrhizobium altum]MCC8952756.1 MBL fold metallo-hydrolase [Bradyrhizobium altum]
MADDNRVPASTATREANRAVTASLPPDTSEDKANVTRGFIGTLADPRIVNAGGHLIWDLSPKLPDAGSPPDTVNPSLWRQVKLLDHAGLFQAADGVYQVRGFDAANMTVIRGDTGYILIDPLGVVETAQAALRLVRERLGDRPVSGIIYTHPHPDHYGGGGGVLAQAQRPAANVPVLAPTGFTQALFSEQVMTGNVIGRRAIFQFGSTLPWSPEGTMGIGVANGFARGTLALAPPTRFINRTGEVVRIDGVDLEFQLTPGTEAEAEMNIFLPQKRVLCLAENANQTLHNLLPVRGAPVRSARAWSGFLEEALHRYGDRTDVVILSHTWPVFGAKAARRFIENQSDLYGFLHDQTIRWMNAGLTPNEIAQHVILPPALRSDWSTRSYYGSLSFNVRAIYQQYLGWYDGNPAHLDPLPPQALGAKYVAAIGGAERVLALADAAHASGDDRWAIELLNRLVVSEPGNVQARTALAAAYTQLGYRQENSIWRNVYLSAADELLHDSAGNRLNQTTRLLKAGPDSAIADLLAVRLDPDKAGDLALTIRLSFPAEARAMTLSVRNAVLRLEDSSQKPDVTVTVDRTEMLQYLVDGGSKSPIEPNAISGDATLATRFFTLFPVPKSSFALTRSNDKPISP